MVGIAGQDFNENMSSYIEHRKKDVTPFELENHKEKQVRLKTQESYNVHDTPTRKSFFQSIAHLFRKRIPSDEEIDEHMKKLSEEEHIEAEEIREEIEEIEQTEDELEMEKESLLGRLWRKLGFGTKGEIVSDEEMETLEQEQTVADEETAETIKILHKWLEQLPPEKLSEFKNSPDFVKYKELLRKLGMIKQ